MGPEDSEPFKVEPGRIWMVPASAEAIEEVQAIKWDLSKGFNFDRGDDRGSDGGLDGGLQGWPYGALAEGKLESWSISMEVAAENFEWFAAALLGKTVEEYRDLVRWAEESVWLQRVTGLNWGHFE